MTSGKKIFIHEAVVSELVKFIRSNQYNNGDKLPSERTLASYLAVSRTSIREALKILQANGIVTIRHGSGVYFNGPENFLFPDSQSFGKSQETLQLLKQLAQTRIMIETFCSAELARFITAEQLKELYAVIEDEATLLEGSGQNQDVFISMKLELLISHYYGNPFIYDMHKKICLQWQQFFLSLESTPYPLDLRHEDHLKMMKAIESGNKASIEKAVRGHIQRTVDILDRLLKE